jgi:hypothetical protein
VEVVILQEERGREGRGKVGTLLVSRRVIKNYCGQQGVQHGIAWASATEKKQTSELDTLPTICQRAKRETEN